MQVGIDENSWWPWANRTQPDTGFSVPVKGDSRGGLINQPLCSACRPFPALTRHNYGHTHVSSEHIPWHSPPCEPNRANGCPFPFPRLIGVPLHCPRRAFRAFFCSKAQCMPSPSTDTLVPRLRWFSFRALPAFKFPLLRPPNYPRRDRTRLTTMASPLRTGFVSAAPPHRLSLPKFRAFEKSQQT